MFIPKTITVGYNERKDTYTGKLAYIIYTDDKGVLRKETSWQGWRVDKLGRDDFDNVPTSGFVLNRGVGGARMSYGSNARNEYIRVYDPRNFEFEISVSNLLFILQESSSIKGKGLEGEFVYSWDGKELVLLPVGCQEHDECIEHTRRQSIKFDKKDIQEGYSYVMKDGTEVLYLGRHNYNDYNDYYRGQAFNPIGKKHVFLDLNPGEYGGPYLPQPGFTKIAECTSSSSLPQFADEYEKFKKSNYCGDVKKLSVRKIKFSADFTQSTLLIKEDDKYYTAKVVERYSGYSSRGGGWNRDKAGYDFFKSKKPFNLEIKNGAVKLPPLSNVSENVSSMGGKDLYTLSVVTEQGKKLRCR